MMLILFYENWQCLLTLRTKSMFHFVKPPAMVQPLRWILINFLFWMCFVVGNVCCTFHGLCCYQTCSRAASKPIQYRPVHSHECNAWHKAVPHAPLRGIHEFSSITTVFPIRLQKVLLYIFGLSVFILSALRQVVFPVWR
jgi:hypothetical protein